MKALRNISLTVVLLASLSACVENDPTYNVYPSDDVALPTTSRTKDTNSTIW